MPRTAMTVRDIDRGFDKLKQLGRQLRDGNTYCKVGIIGDKKNAGDVRGKGGITTVDLALVHEFGSPSRHIPERSWIRSTFDQQTVKLNNLSKFYVRKIYEGKLTPERALGLLGAEFAADIKNRVTQGSPIPPPNAERTINAKMKKSRRAFKANANKARKLSGEKRLKGEGAAQGPLLIRTLIDTSRMINSTSWVVVVEGKEAKAG